MIPSTQPFEVLIQQYGGLDEVNIYIMRRDPIGMDIIQIRDSKMVLVRHKEAEEVKPTLTLSGPVSKPLLKALAQGLLDFGVRVDPDAEMAGELRATKQHLGDMRKITFKSMEITDGESKGWKG